MLREFAWKTFENTGSVNAYVFYREIETYRRQESQTKLAQDEVASIKQTLDI